MTSRSVLAALALVLALACAPADGPERTPPSAPAARVDAADVDVALAQGLAHLLAAQRQNGTWRSTNYPFLADGPALTAPISKALVMAQGHPGVDEALERALAALARLVTPEGRIDAGPAGLSYPVTTASLAVILLGRVDAPGAPGQRAAWLAHLRGFQLDESLGWTPDDLAYGGWGFARRPPRRAPIGAHRPAGEADLSSTLFALGALRSAGVPADDPAVARALVFVERCQNFGRPGDDGGFFLSPTNAARNKAGPVDTGARVAGTTGPDARPRQRSYGSATADGLRALLRCGLPTDHPRVVAATAWLERNFRADANPGDFLPAREVERAGSFSYWCWSFAHAMRLLGRPVLQTPDGPVAWAPRLAAAVLERQLPDGSWRNPVTTLLEDDPLVATPLALAALGISRWFLADGERPRDPATIRPPRTGG